MSFYTEMQDVAAEILTEYGIAGTLTKSGQTVSDASRPWEGTTPSSPVTEAVVAAVVPVSEEEDVKLLESIGGYKESGNVLVSAKGLSNTIKPNDYITAAGKKWKLIKAVPIQPADVIVMYNCVGII